MITNQQGKNNTTHVNTFKNSVPFEEFQKRVVFSGDTYLLENLEKTIHRHRTFSWQFGWLTT